MARPLSDHAKKLIDYLDAKPATLATAARDLGIEYKTADKLLYRLKYAERVLVLKKERLAHCRKPVALYVTPQWWERNKEKEAA